ncbi:ATPase, histidine kinase-, DNA gyrase B (macronuclear) [Tetrahymena thermophila SB210]|uniref:histidine kinase n=1 Tax=Tetrahymena thermophila (strain SB210) TaxID=312017 RepID=I7MGT8_TETTS|nr:ATPase, histidine kinase-, DNA gyrase B [Tetrahymena thermophila SB210]EAS02037.2 ATPase, histidine kinase-, DNA gyrase B [Tetrahymena thermophila SB210]|eukprot:XP_001022282.2 ATPase, histidine kinase-, DNA gyrase B [Tetrahymena thermophila SB210]
MVFVTFPKKKKQNSEQALSKISLKHKIINFCSKIIPETFKTQKSNLNTPNSELKYRIQKEQTVTKLDTNIRNSTENSNNNQIIYKKLENSGLVFNFVNKKFYDQFQIKEWVDTQRKSISENTINMNFQYSFADLIHMEDFQQQKGNWICSESPLHQILFNNIFKNIIVSHPNPSQNDSKTFMDLDNTADFTQNSTESTCTLSDYLKQFIEDKQNGEKDGLNNFITNQSSKTKIQKDQNNQQNTKQYQKPLKQLSCFYRQLSPTFLLGQQQQQQSQQMQPKENIQSTQDNNKQDNLQIKEDICNVAEAKDYVLENQKPQNQYQKNKNNSIQDQRSKIITANFGGEDRQNLNTQNTVDVEQGQAKLLQSEKRRNASNDFKKHEISINSHINNNCDTTKKNQHEIICASEDTQRNTEREMLLPSQSNLKNLINHIQKNKQSEDRHQQRQVSFQNSQTENNNQQQNYQQYNNPSDQKQQNGVKQVDNIDGIVINIIDNQKQENCQNSNFQKLEDQRNKNNQVQQQDNAFFFDTQMVRCLWGNEEGILLIFNDISLKIINEKLREIERFKDKMLSTVTHDLKTPLNSIIMILENSFELGGLNKKQRKIILQNSQMLMSLINDILDYSQLRRDKFRLIIEEICLTQCILDVLDLFEIQAEQKNINISAKFINLQQDYIMQDERRIKQILVNLIGNALKFTQQKGKIEVIVKQKYIDCIQISVKDTGTGISEQIQKKLFQFFNTFDHSERANNRHGIGLGLAICKQLNNQLGPWHEIKLKSKVDQGSKFTFCIYTNLVEHQQVGQQYNNQISPLKSKANYDNAHFFMTSSKQKLRDQSKLIVEGQNQHLGDVTFTEPLKNHISIHNSQVNVQIVPSPVSINKLTPQAGKQSQLLQSISPYSQKNENGIEKSQKSEFNTQQELKSKSQNSPKNMNHLSQEVKTDNLYNKNSISKPLSREIQSNQVQRKVGNQKINSMIVLNSQQQLEQQNSTSFSKYLDQKHQLLLPLKRSIKRDYIILKGSRHKLLNQQRAYSLKLQTEEVNRRKKSLLFCKSQTIDARKNSKRLTHIQQSMANQVEEQQKNNKFCSENCLLHSFSHNPNQKLQSDTNSCQQHQQSLGYQLPENVISSKLIRIGNQTQTTLNFNNSINISDYKKIDKRNKDSCCLNYAKDQFCMQGLQDFNKAFNDDQAQRKKTKNMFIRVAPKFQEQQSCIKQNPQPKQDLQESSFALEHRLSENFGENDELYKNQQTFKYQEINIHQQIDKQHNLQNQSKSFHDIQIAQSIPELQNQENGIFVNNLRYNYNQLSNKKSTYILNSKQQQEDKQQNKIESFQNLHNSINKISKSITQNNTKEIKDVNQIKIYEVGHKMENISHKREEQNANAADEWREDDEEMCEESEEDYEEDQVQHHNFKELASNYKFIENNNEKQMVWVQNDRKLQVEILKTLLQDYSKVLIADDSPFNIFCLKQILTKNINLNIFDAYNGNEALNSYKQNRQQIIFMDLNMPVLDGYECLKCIRQYEEENHIEEKTKVIVISAQEYEPFFSNFDGYLSKPIKLIDMINLLQIFRQNQTNISSSQPQI